MKTKILISVAIAAVIVLIVSLSRCKKPKPIDQTQQIIDSLTAVISDKEKEIAKLDELVTHYAQEYDSTAKVNDSLQKRGVKTIEKYKEVRADVDTAAILAVCDSMATEYEAFIQQTRETLKAADSVMTTQADAIQARDGQIETYKALVNKLEEKLEAQEKEIDKWRKLAKRRGRAIEW